MNNNLYLNTCQSKTKQYIPPQKLNLPNLVNTSFPSSMLNEYITFPNPFVTVPLKHFFMNNFLLLFLLSNFQVPTVLYLLVSYLILV